MIVDIPHQARVVGGRVCFAQNTNNGLDQNVWGMGSFRLVDRPTVSHHFAQFRLNLDCGQVNASTRFVICVARLCTKNIVLC